MEPIKVKSLANLGTACPSQWEGEAEDGREVFVRFRWGKIRVYLDDEVVFEKQITDGADGFMTDPQMEKALDGVLVFPVGETIGE